MKIPIRIFKTLSGKFDYDTMYLKSPLGHSEFETINEAKQSAIERYSRQNGCLSYDIALNEIKFIVDKGCFSIHSIPYYIEEWLDAPENALLNDKELYGYYVCDCKNELIYCDEEICYYNCFDGDFLYINTIDAIKLCSDFKNTNDDLCAVRVNDLLSNNIHIDFNGDKFLNVIKEKILNNSRDIVYVSQDADFLNYNKKLNLSEQEQNEPDITGEM